MDLNCSSQKRRRAFEVCDNSAKKRCVHGANSVEAQTANPMAENSLSTSPLLSSRHPPVMELSSRTPDSHLCTEPPFVQPTCLEVSYTSKSSQPSCTALSPKTNPKQSMGTEQVFQYSIENDIVKLSLPSKPAEETSKTQENDKRDKSSIMLSPEVSRRDTSSSPHVSHHSGHTNCITPVLPVKALSRGKQVTESSAKPACKPSSGHPSCSAVNRKRITPRRPVKISNDEDALFTPDPMTYVVSSANKTTKLNKDQGTIKSSTCEKSLFSTVTTSSTPFSGSSCQKSQNATATEPSHSVDAKDFSATLKHFLPTVDLVRVKPAVKSTEKLTSKEGDIKNDASVKKLKEKSVKSDEKCTSVRPNNVRSHTLDSDMAASKQTSTSCSQSPPLERQASEGGSKQIQDDDPIDMELGLSFALDLDLTQSSHSSEEEQLLSLQEMMQRVAKPPDTPEKGAYSEPSTPGRRNCQSKIVSCISFFLWFSACQLSR